MAAERGSPNGKTGAPGWRVVSRAVNQHGDLVYDVFHGKERRAWGLKDAATAQRWMRRLSGDSLDTSGTESTEETEDEAFVPPRVWWNEG